MQARLHHSQEATCRCVVFHTDATGEFATLEVTVRDSSVTLFFQSKDEVIDFANKILTATAV